MPIKFRSLYNHSEIFLSMDTPVAVILLLDQTQSNEVSHYLYSKQADSKKID